MLVIHRSVLRYVGHANFPWHCLYFLPEPQGQGLFRPTLGWSRTSGRITGVPDDAALLGTLELPIGGVGVC